MPMPATEVTVRFRGDKMGNLQYNLEPDLHLGKQFGRSDRHRKNNCVAQISEGQQNEICR